MRDHLSFRTELDVDHRFNEHNDTQITNHTFGNRNTLEKQLALLRELRFPMDLEASAVALQLSSSSAPSPQLRLSMP
jgi:hypothetical protein